jgi:glycolate oxidase
MSENINNLIKELEKIVGKNWIVTERRLMEDYLRDETPDPVRPSPAIAREHIILVKPANTDEVSGILKLADREKIPVFPVGGRTGLVGGAIPVKPGIVLSLERMNKIDIDQDNLMATAEAGITLRELTNTVEDAGMFFPLHPGDEGAQLGGLVATNAGGVRAVKYGIMRNYVKGLEVVLPTGEVLRLGGKLLKNNTGYSLMHLMVGSEGTLGVITKAVIKLHPKSKFAATLIVPFGKRHDAINAVPKILQSGVTPLAIEYIEIGQMEKSAEHLREKWPVDKGKAQLIVILTAITEDELYFGCEKISEVCEANGAFETMLAGTKEEQDRILKIRSNVYTAMKSEMCDTLDITVPPNELGALMDLVDGIASKFDACIPVYGHAGDGNLHVHIMKEDGKKPQHIEKMKKEIYRAGVSLGGVITGEHGIGKIRVKNLELVLSKKEIDLMREMKRMFDPNNILNPGKVVKQIDAL